MISLTLKDKLAILIINFLFGLRHFKGRLFAVRLLLRFTSVSPSKYGPVIRVRKDDVTNKLSIFAGYGNEIPDQIRKLGPNDVFLDIGANTGVFSLVASDIVKEGFVIAFEPNPWTFADLCFNIRTNKRGNVIALNLAISNADKLYVIEHNKAHSGATSLKLPYVRPTTPLDPGTEHLVVAIKPENLKVLLDVTSHRRIGIKIDVEGHELNVLQGLSEAGLLDRTDWVIVEIDQNNLDRYEASISDIYDMMRENNFSPLKGENTSEHYDEIFSHGSELSPPLC